MTPEGKGQVIGLNILDISMQVKIDGLEQPLEHKMEERSKSVFKYPKISGACGRLMCCLKYENDFYEEAEHSYLI